MSWYRSGSISLTNGSTAVVGTGTDFVAGAAVGESVVAPDGKVYEIAAVVSATSLTLGSNYLGTTASGQAYAIAPTQSYIRDLAGQAAALINTYSGLVTNAAAGKFPDGTLSVPSIRFTTDDNTGINHLTSDSFDLVTNGVSRLNVSNSGLAGDATGLSNTIAPQTVAATSKTTPVDADLIPLVDSAASNVLKKLTWANLKATAKTYFDTLYLGIAATAANASQLLGKTWASPDPIGNTTPNTGAFTTLSATGVISADSRLRFTANGYANVDATVSKSPTYGLILQGAVGSGYDFGLISSTGSLDVIRVPTGTNTVQLVGAATVGGNATFSANAFFTDTNRFIAASGSNLIIGADGSGAIDLRAAGVVRATVSSAGVAATGAVTATTTMSTGGYTVATLPAGSVGDRAYVTDATAPTFLGALTGGGAVRTPVFKNASAWVAA